MGYVSFREGISTVWNPTKEGLEDAVLVAGFNPSEKYWSKWKPSPNRDENKKYLNTPPSVPFFVFFCQSDFQVPASSFRASSTLVRSKPQDSVHKSGCTR